MAAIVQTQRKKNKQGLTKNAHDIHWQLFTIFKQL